MGIEGNGPRSFDTDSSSEKMSATTYQDVENMKCQQ
jgi:hypothetical protein